jgi:hypothetical protein
MGGSPGAALGLCCIAAILPIIDAYAAAVHRIFRRFDRRLLFCGACG